MRRSKMWFLILMLVTAMVVAACGGAADSEPTAAQEAMGDNAAAHETDDEMAADNMTDSNSNDDMMDENSNDDMMESNSNDDMMESNSNDDMMDSNSNDDMMDSNSNDDMMDSNSNDDMMDENSNDDMMMGETAVLSLSFTGLEDLGEGWAYEGWLIVDDQPISTGVFTVDEMGHPSATEFEVDSHDLEAAALFVLTIEPSPDDDPAPSAVHLLAGEFDEGSADLSISHAAALGTDFASAEGSTYILGIPTSDMADDNYTSGIWFTGLDLPPLPEGWIYEGWVVGPDGPISTGRFKTAMEADSDGAGPTAGPLAGPAYPGQDYLNPAIDLTSGYAAVISVEPDPDNSPAPFTLKPLIDMTIEDSGDHVDQAISYDAGSFPAGMATR